MKDTKATREGVTSNKQNVHTNSQQLSDSASTCTYRNTVMLVHTPVSNSQTL